LVGDPGPESVRVGRIEWILLAVIAATWLAMLFWSPATLHDDARRFMEIASSPGTPYRDFAVEYPPLATVLTLLVGDGSESAVVWRVALVNAASTVGCWWLLRRFWSQRVSILFLWFALPLQPIMAFRIDALSVTMILGAIVLADRRYIKTGAVAAAASIALRVWPVVVSPVFLLRGRTRAFVLTVLVTTLLGLVWIVASGTSAFTQVSGYRGATGWQVESGPALVVEIIHPDEPFRSEQGAVRVGSMQPWEMRLLRLLTVGLVVLAWFLGSRRPIDPTGAPALAAVAALLVFSPVFSPQYVSWLIPWAAIVAAERRDRTIGILMIGAGVFASLTMAMYMWERSTTGLEVFSFGRMACVVGLGVIGFTHRRVDAMAEIQVATPAATATGEDA
jgi:glycosyl transferase family 87